ncbi:3-phosphoshikimate 1-carboxyvinyltransferase [Burkholderia oklahomensis]|uniref:3-phosphoshikimate 1-carboxyvinyltransferase n=1 Tax=Burkholderia oklahomensis TaxID=342113 RepID=UPI00016A8279|nr:3-phosphoshikimate 1-carboxyvinyltransferase [Burkholderia oklahomensis]AJX32706.1 EPSP synthase family protein [Burkholderia oklahomensis C6786]AOI47038.1 3-phosphoshikimate 1-carboxyvinyltransferase [Burkholderia oklahomensis C6786]KUY59921.1 3-phosphoshikimate 1-carboxyvinyltransferase [Burkholderia oklahomensis C6786]MBI0360286.1 3-phosphoshikimate 1-carboxyvinyltransferase [Burkholderia oklahomensis]SUW59670.1 3-phosphoshikimate 1-carboxyvinyltransferase [Burkholderia oklahomensis]
MSHATVYPSGALKGATTLPASKPHVQRALLLGLLNGRTTRIENMSWCAETELQFAALRQFGMTVVERTATSLTLRGVGSDVEASGAIDAAGSGMLFRMSAALAALATEPVTIRCNDSLFSRDSVFDAGFFSHLGIDARRAEGNLVTISRKSHPERVPLTTHKSTQFISFALFVAPFSADRTLRVADDGSHAGYIDMSVKTMSLLHSAVVRTPGSLTASEYRADDIVVRIPTDFTSLSYIASAALSVGAESDIEIANYRPGDTLNEQTLFDVYRELGIRLTRDDARHTLRIERERAFRRSRRELSLHELPSAATNIIAAASNLGDPIRFGGVDGINNHKCQRAFVINENIRAMGGRSALVFNDVGRFDKIDVMSDGPLHGGAELPSYRDHRICAANIIASLGAQRKSIVHDTDKLDDGFPKFIDTLRALGAEIA